MKDLVTGGHYLVQRRESPLWVVAVYNGPNSGWCCADSQTPFVWEVETVGPYLGTIDELLAEKGVM